MFQSTPAHDGRRAFRGRPTVRLGFNPRPHTTGDPTRVSADHVLREFQSTPAHDGRRHPRMYLRRCCGVSIHARTRRATVVFVARCRAFSVSIHARTRRATSCLCALGPKLCFNPRPHTTGDQLFRKVFHRLDCFNPRPHTTGDFVHQHGGISTTCFNPRPHTTGDRRSCGILRRSRGFNPRPHTTGDSKWKSGREASQSFNPRPHTTGDATLPNLLQDNTLRHPLREPSPDHDSIEY